MSTYSIIIDALHNIASKSWAEQSKKFFKITDGKIANDDIFIGVSIPQIRAISKTYFADINLNDIQMLLHSQIHEEKMLALIIAADKYKKTQDANIVSFYLNKKNMKYINNWDLVDVSCYKILGEYLLKNKNKINILYTLANSTNLWERRISIVCTYTFIKQGVFNHTIDIAKKMFNDKEDLIHKATGWMLREVGKRDSALLQDFLTTNHTKMPRIMLRYANERLKIKLS